MDKLKSFKWKVVQPRKATQLTKRDFEIRVREFKDHGNFKKIQRFFTRQDLRWNPDTLHVLKLKSQEFDLPKNKVQAKEQRSLRIPFDGGGEFRLLLLGEQKAISECQVALRKQLHDVLKLNRTALVRIDIADLLPDLQRKLLSWIGSLIVLAPFKAPKFVKAAKKATAKPISYSVEIVTDVETSLANELIKAGEIIGNGTNLVRYLAELPGNYLRPKMYQQLIAKRARERKYRYEIFDRRRLETMGAGAFLAVAQASDRDQGGMVHLSFRPTLKLKARKPLPKIVVVGKGICFDTGGYNVKTGPHMYSMHRDMTGSAVALAVFEAAVAMKLPVEIHAILAIAENVIAPNGFRPNDVVTAMDGTTIEIVDTDAEGRLVLADSLAFAKRLKPDLTLDFATLTGAAVRAIGTHRSAVFSNRKELLELAHLSGEAAGERVWGFPIGDEYAEGIKSDFADVLQCSVQPGPDHILAATFLSRFISDDCPWIHCDLSSETQRGGLGLVGTETTGFGVRWALEVIQRFFRIRNGY
jgi:leucyl aminopeptidase